MVEAPQLGRIAGTYNRSTELCRGADITNRRGSRYSSGSLINC
jgi:hypothetical protein